MAINNAIGRAGQVGFTPAGNTGVEIVGITQFIRDLAKSDQNFRKEANKASTAVANLLVVAAKFETELTLTDLAYLGWHAEHR